MLLLYAHCLLCQRIVTCNHVRFRLFWLWSPRDEQSAKWSQWTLSAVRPSATRSQWTLWVARQSATRSQWTLWVARLSATRSQWTLWVAQLSDTRSQWTLWVAQLSATRSQWTLCAVNAMLMDSVTYWDFEIVTRVLFYFSVMLYLCRTGIGSNIQPRDKQISFLLIVCRVKVGLIDGRDKIVCHI